MMDVIRVGSTLLIQFPGEPKPHLWLVLTDPSPPISRVVMVMVRSVKAYTDPTVILQVGDHPFIKQPSSIHYSSAKWFEIAKINRRIVDGSCHPKENMSKELLARAQQGLIRSPFTVNPVREFCRHLFDSDPPPLS